MTVLGIEDILVSIATIIFHDIPRLSLFLYDNGALVKLVSTPSAMVLSKDPIVMGPLDSSHIFCWILPNTRKMDKPVIIGMSISLWRKYGVLEKASWRMTLFCEKMVHILY